MNFAQSLSRVTNSTLFLLKGLELDIEKIRKFGFINAYLYMKDYYVDIDKPVFVLFKPPSMLELEGFLCDEVGSKKEAQLIEDIDLEEGYVVFVYEWPSSLNDVWDAFLSGKYSKMPKSYQDRFPKKVNKQKSKWLLVPTISIYGHIFGKTEDLKKFWEESLDITLNPEDEYWGIPSQEKETLDIKKIIENARKD